MSTASDLKDIFASARPLVEQALDLTEQFAALRDAATDKGLDWSQIKALVKAQVQDERDGAAEGKRVNRIIEKADFASAYADMLGLGAKMNEKNNLSDDLTNDPVLSVSVGGASGEMKLSTLSQIADAARTDTGRKVLASALAANDCPDIPPELDCRVRP